MNYSYSLISHAKLGDSLESQVLVVGVVDREGLENVVHYGRFVEEAVVEEVLFDRDVVKEGGDNAAYDVDSSGGLHGETQVRDEGEQDVEVHVDSVHAHRMVFVHHQVGNLFRGVILLVLVLLLVVIIR